jgi:branched-chain amino acid transport system substrate-binding protein
LKSTSKVDFVFVCSYPPGGASAIKQIRESGIKLPLVGGDTFDGTYWTKGITKLSNFYAPVAANVHTADPRPSITKFVKEYRALVGVRPLNSLAVFAHQGAEVYFRAVQKAGTLNSDKVLKVLETSKNVPTIAGPFTFTRRDHFNTTGTVTFIEYQNGKLRFKALVKPKVVPPVDY